MPIAYSNGVFKKGTGGDITQAFTVTGDSPVLLVYGTAKSTTPPTSCSYDGVQGVRIGTVAITTTYFHSASLFYFQSPTVGASRNIVLSGSGGGHLLAMSFTGAAQGILGSAVLQATGTSNTSWSASITTLYKDCLIAGFTAGGSGSAGSWTTLSPFGGTNKTNRFNMADWTAYAYTGDAVIASPGANTITASWIVTSRYLNLAVALPSAGASFSSISSITT